MPGRVERRKQALRARRARAAAPALAGEGKVTGSRARSIAAVHDRNSTTPISQLSPSTQRLLADKHPEAYARAVAHQLVAEEAANKASADIANKAAAAAIAALAQSAPSLAPGAAAAMAAATDRRSLRVEDFPALLPSGSRYTPYAKSEDVFAAEIAQAKRIEAAKSAHGHPQTVVHGEEGKEKEGKGKRTEERGTESVRAEMGLRAGSGRPCPPVPLCSSV